MKHYTNYNSIKFTISYCICVYTCMYVFLVRLLFGSVCVCVCVCVCARARACTHVHASIYTHVSDLWSKPLLLARCEAIIHQAKPTATEMIQQL